MNKKGQIASGITWIVGFLIIFFIMALFMSASLLLAGGRRVALVASNIGIEESNANLVEVKSLSAFLNTPISIDGENKKIADLILMVKKNSKYDEQLIEEMEKFIAISNPACYIFRTDVIRMGNPVGIIDLTEFRRGNSRQLQQIFIDEKGTALNLYYKNEKIKLELYMGKCEL